MKLLINTTRDGYCTERCGRTMTVVELMSVLAQCAGGAFIFLCGVLAARFNEQT